uniref:NR LBD domain-containing protein n=1 Tax=Heterorhabditis bacteriophora TaxID=37862 RepID=A0A1I7WJ32_HETBA
MNNKDVVRIILNIRSNGHLCIKPVLSETELNCCILSARLIHALPILRLHFRRQFVPSVEIKPVENIMECIAVQEERQTIRAQIVEVTSFPVASEMTTFSVLPDVTIFPVTSESISPPVALELSCYPAAPESTSFIESTVISHYSTISFESEEATVTYFNLPNARGNDGAVDIKENSLKTQISPTLHHQIKRVLHWALMIPAFRSLPLYDQSLLIHHGTFIYIGYLKLLNRIILGWCELILSDIAYRRSSMDTILLQTHNDLKQDSGCLNTFYKFLNELTAKFRDLEVDKMEIGALRLIVLLNSG